MFCLNEIKKRGLLGWFKRSLGYHLYFNFAQYLPQSFCRGGRFAKWLRAWCCRQFLTHVGEDVNIERGADIQSLNVSIGDHSGIGIRCQVYGDVTIGRDVMMGPDCEIHSGCHEFCRTDVPMREQGFKLSRPVTIGDDVWIGSRVIILPGVKIGKGCVIGAGSVVPKDIPDYAIAAGNPAVVKKFRKTRCVDDSDN